MNLSVERIVAIIACMYGQKAEIVVNIAEGAIYLFFDGIPQNLDVLYEEVDCLVYNGIIEFDGGCDEEGHETEVYRLTDMAESRIQEIIKTGKVKNRNMSQLSLEG